MSEQQKTVKKQIRNPATNRHWLYTVVRGVCAFLLGWLLPVKFHNRERVNNIDGAFIMTGNHLSLLDPVVLAVAVKKRQVAFMAKAELSKAGWFKYVALKMHAIFVNRHQSDMEAMRESMKAIRGGEILGIFPEGTRHHQGLMEQQEAGAAMIALRSGVPMVPVYISGSLKLFRTTHCYVGEPVEMDDLRQKGINKETCQELMDRLTACYKEMKAAVDAL